MMWPGVLFSLLFSVYAHLFLQFLQTPERKYRERLDPVKTPTEDDRFPIISFSHYQEEGNEWIEMIIQQHGGFFFSFTCFCFMYFLFSKSGQQWRKTCRRGNSSATGPENCCEMFENKKPDVCNMFTSGCQDSICSRSSPENRDFRLVQRHNTSSHAHLYIGVCNRKNPCVLHMLMICPCDMVNFCQHIFYLIS